MTQQTGPVERLLQRMRYAFDLTMAAGPIALIGWLAVASLVVLALAALVLVAGHIHQPDAETLDFPEALWEAMMRALDPGGVGGDQGWTFRLVMLLVTFWGILVVSALIGLLSADVQERLDELRKGRSIVLEQGHTLVLNWSHSIFDVISELCVAHSHGPRLSIVILADKEKVEMEDEIAAKVRTHRNVRIVCRSGDPGDLHDLAIANINAARAVIILAPENDDPDTQNIKTVLAIVHGPNRRSKPHRIAVEVRDARNAAVLRAVGGDEIQPVVADDLISRIIANSSRQTGLSAVYSELLEFEGCEIYTQAQPAIIGKSFGEAIFQFESGALIGVCDADGRVRLNPSSDEKIEHGALAVLVAADSSDVVLAKPKHFSLDEAALRARGAEARHPERALVLGWNRRGPLIVRELTKHMAPGSSLLIAADAPGLSEQAAALAGGAEGVSITHQAIDTRQQAALDALDSPACDHIIVLSYSDQMPAQAADTRTLVTLLHLQHIGDRGGRTATVISEMADVRNRELAEATRADDFVVSNRLVSLMLAQASEGDHISTIFAELLDEKGAEIYLRPASLYVDVSQPVNFFTILEAGRQRGETAFGYCHREAGGRGVGKVVLNPRKSEKINLGGNDMIVVVAHG